MVGGRRGVGNKKVNDNNKPIANVKGYEIPRDRSRGSGIEKVFCISEGLRIAPNIKLAKCFASTSLRLAIMMLSYPGPSLTNLYRQRPCPRRTDARLPRSGDKPLATHKGHLEHCDDLFRNILISRLFYTLKS